jgi:hypothetical protein
MNTKTQIGSCTHKNNYLSVLILVFSFVSIYFIGSITPKRAAGSAS